MGQGGGGGGSVGRRLEATGGRTTAQRSWGGGWGWAEVVFG